MEYDALLANFDTELKRGALTLSILSQLEEAQYGYSLLQRLTGQGVEVEAGTLYPLLRRLEAQGVLTSTWDTSQSRPRKFYVRSEMGSRLYLELRRNWYRMNEQMTWLMGGEQDANK